MIEKFKTDNLFFFTLKVSILTSIIILIDLSSKIYANNQGMAHLNPGISFGLIENLSQWLPIGIVFFLLVFIFLGWQSWRKNFFALSLLLGGSLANLIDRMINGAITDWIPIPLTNLYNNVADWAIFFSLLIFLNHLNQSNKNNTNNVK